MLYIYTSELAVDNTKIVTAYTDIHLFTMFLYTSSSIIHLTIKLKIINQFKENKYHGLNIVLKDLWDVI